MMILRLKMMTSVTAASPGGTEAPNPSESEQPTSRQHNMIRRAASDRSRVTTASSSSGANGLSFVLTRAIARCSWREYSKPIIFQHISSFFNKLFNMFPHFSTYFLIFL